MDDLGRIILQAERWLREFLTDLLDDLDNRLIWERDDEEPER